MKIIIIVFSFLLVIGCNSSENIAINQDDNEMEVKKASEKVRSDKYIGTTYLKAGDLAPEFELPTVDNKTFSSTDMKGKLTIINYFGLSCPICMKELPHFETEIWQKYKENDQIAIITIGREETIEDLLAFRNKKAFTFPIASDLDREVYALFAKKMIPRNIVIDQSGKIIYHEIGFSLKEFNNFKSLIEEYLTKE